MKFSHLFFWSLRLARGFAMAGRSLGTRKQTTQ